MFNKHSKDLRGFAELDYILNGIKKRKSSLWILIYQKHLKVD